MVDKKVEAVIEVVLREKDSVLIRRASPDAPILYVSGKSRDAICAANAFLVILLDSVTDHDTQMAIHRLLHHLSDMLYGFPKETPS